MNREQRKYDLDSLKQEAMRADAEQAKPKTMTDKKELAEQILSHYNNVEWVGEGEPVYSREQMLAAIIEAMGVQPVMRWVKASERLPVDPANTHYRNIQTKQPIPYRSVSFHTTFYTWGRFWLSAYHIETINVDSIEWLEEAPAIAQ